MPLMFGLGVTIQWLCVRRIKRERVMMSILLMYAIALVIEGGLDLVFSASLVQLQAPYADSSFPLLGFRLPYIYLFIFLLSAIFLALLYLVVYRTRFGFSRRASSQDRTAAALIGIEVEKVQAFAFGIGVALAGAGGVAYGATLSFNAASSYDLIVRLLVIIVLGGMGSLQGALRRLPCCHWLAWSPRSLRCRLAGLPCACAITPLL